MGRRLRPSPDATKDRNDHVDFMVQFDVPVKARTVLGASSGVHPVAPRITTPEPLRELLAASALAASSGAQKGGPHDTAQRQEEAMYRSETQWGNGSNSDVRYIPNSSGVPKERSRKESSQSVRPHQFYSEQKPSTESVKGPFYEHSEPPLFVSQQHASSAVRDMPFHKGSRTVLEITNQPRSDAKPLKSALKQPKLTKNQDGSKRSKRLDISSLFASKGGSSERLLSPAKQSQSSLAFSDTSHTTQQSYQTRNIPAPDDRSEAFQDGRKTVALGQPRASTAPRVKIFDPDLYDEAKIHKRKPPKGIRNWFDGFEISSDEEDKASTAELRPTSTRAHAGTHRGSSQDKSGQHPASKKESKSINMNATPRAVHSHRPEVIETKPVSRPRQQRVLSAVSTTPSNLSSLLDPGSARLHEDDRMAHVHLETESVLAFSDDSEDDRRKRLSSVREGSVVQASATTLQRPSIPPRKVHSKPSLTDGGLRKASLVEEAIRKSTSTSQTFGSIPIRLTDSMQMPPMPRSGHYLPHDSESIAQESLPTRGSRSVASPVARSSISQHSKGKPDSRSGRELHSAGGDTSSSAEYSMTVTEEEMMLLELMRQKRAAMQKNSFAEGYRLALKQEEEHLAKKRTSAHRSAMKQLQRREEERRQRALSSLAESVPDSVLGDEDQREQDKRYSMLRRQSVDKTLKLGRYLATIQSGAESGGEAGSLPKMEKFLSIRPSLLDAIRDTHRMSGTEIEEEVMTEQDDLTFEDMYTVEDEDVVDERGVIIHSAGPSPLQRLRNMVRPTEKPIQEKVSHGSIVSDTKTRPTTSSTGSPRPSTGAFPMPPLSQAAFDEPQADRRSLLVSPITEARLAPGSPVRSRSASPLPSPSRQPNTSRTADRDPTDRRLATPSPAPPTDPQPPSNGTAHGELQLPNFAPLELPLVTTASPSLSTSRPSPLTPTFTPAALDRSAAVMSSSDDSSIQHMYTSSPEPRVRPSPPVAIKPQNKKLAHIDTGPHTQRVSSMTSASEDVLAAWAELGGGRL